MCFLISFLVVGFMQFFYDLSSLGNFYSFSVDIIVLLFLVGSCTFCMCTLCSLSTLIFLFLSTDENSNIDFGAIHVFLLLLLLLLLLLRFFLWFLHAVTQKWLIICSIFFLIADGYDCAKNCIQVSVGIL